MSLQAELKRQREHGAWLAWKRSARPEGSEPPAGYKDCRNCTLRSDLEDLEQRVRFCATDCPFADLPVGPSRDFVAASLWAGLPEAFLVEFAADLGWPMVLGIAMLRQVREAERMGARFLG